jgi:hypothetical protein
VEANSRGGQGSLRAVAPSDDDDDDGDDDDDDDDDDYTRPSIDEKRDDRNLQVL